ncbi:MAG: gamma-glutamyltransferase [Myxococcales bacterium]
MLVHALVAAVLATSAISPRGAVATAHPLASEVGAVVLRSGGNAIDAAVAAAFALGVVQPGSSGLGGGGFALVYVAREKKVYALDFREVAPARATPEMFLRDGKPRTDLSQDGPLAVAVPGAVKGYVELAKRFGRRPLTELTGPAEQLAFRGFQVSAQHARAVQLRLDCLGADPEAQRLYTVRDDEGGRRAPEPGERLVQRDLARTLHEIGLRGDAAFYKGRVARAIAATVAGGGGILTVQDLAAFRVRERAPVSGTYRGFRVVSMPLPSSGGAILLSLLDVLERDDARAGGYRPERFLHVMVEAEKRIFARRESLGDPDANPAAVERVRELVSKEWAGTVRGQIGETATPAAAIDAQREKTDTSHLSVIDEEGNAVALTTTINGAFGSCVVAKGTGVLLNDQMDDFAIAPGVPNLFGVRGGKENAPGPGKVPLSSMAPTLVFDAEGELRLSLGAAGGSTIPTTVAQIISHVVDDKMTVTQALAAPRIHDQLFPDEVRVEANGLESATAAALIARGHKLHFVDQILGAAQAVSSDPETGWCEAAGDPRIGGAGAVP